jgi:hypothetical protein
MAIVPGYPGIAAQQAVLQAVHLGEGNPGQEH